MGIFHEKGMTSRRAIEFWSWILRFQWAGGWDSNDTTKCILVSLFMRDSLEGWCFKTWPSLAASPLERTTAAEIKAQKLMLYTKGS